MSENENERLKRFEQLDQAEQLRQLERLKRFETLLTELQDEQSRVSTQVEQMKAQNKTKTTTFKQLLARKMSLRSFLGTFESHDLL